MTDPTIRRPTIELPVSPKGDLQVYFAGSLTREQIIAFEAIPGEGEWYAAHRDEILKDGKVSSFTLLLSDAAGKLRPVTIAPDGRRAR